MARNAQRGSIEPFGPDRWRVRVSLGRDPVTNKWVRTSLIVDGSKRDAQRALTNALDRQDRTPIVPRGKVTLADWIAEYAETWSSRLAPQTREKAAEILRLYVPAGLASRRLSELTARHFQETYNALAARESRPIGPGTIDMLHRLLRVRLNRAVALGYMGRNPLASLGSGQGSAISLPAAEHREYRVFTAHEAKLFLEEAEPDRYGALWSLLLMTGLRPEEALGLKWDDLEGNRLGVRRALIRLAKGRWELAPTKTRRERSVSVPAVALKVLTRHRARQSETRLLLGSEYANHGLMFAATFGQPLRWENTVTRHFWPIVERVAFRLLGKPAAGVVRKGLKRKELAPAFEAAREAAKVALAKTGLDKMRPYDLRHSAATLLLAAGEHPKVVAERLGHSKVALTLDTYSHVVPGLEERAAERLEAAIMGSTSATKQGGR